MPAHGARQPSRLRARSAAERRPAARRASGRALPDAAWAVTARVEKALVRATAALVGAALGLGGVVLGVGPAAAAPRVEPTGPVSTVPHLAPDPPQPVVGADPRSPSINSRYLKQKLTWKTCSFDGLIRSSIPKASRTRCAKLKVPMDWTHPAAGDISIAIAYSKASSGKSLGLLTSVPGGPGEEGRSATATLARRNKPLMAKYDLLGFDQRGFGASTQVHCRTTRSKVRALPVTADHRDRTAQTHRAELARAALFAEACSGSALSRYVSTQQTVYDLNFLRAFLDRRISNRVGAYKKLNYLGYSYGTWLGAWFADTYPTRVGRFVLDSNLDWSADMASNDQRDAASFERRRDQMFYPWVARRHAEYGYGATAEAVRVHYEDARAKLVTLYAGGYDVPSPQEMDFIIADLLRRNNDFLEAMTYLLRLDDVVTYTETSGAPPELAARAAGGLRRDVARALRTSAAARTVAELRRPSGTPGAVELDQSVDLDEADRIVRCNDTAYPTDTAAVLSEVDARAASYPFTGYAPGLSMCSYWPWAASPRSIDLARVPTMLMIQSEGDPVTAYEGAASAHAIGHTRLVSVDDDGQHGQYIGGPSACVQKIGDAFVFSGKLPAADTVCATKPLPRDSQVYPLAGPVTR